MYCASKPLTWLASLLVIACLSGCDLHIYEMRDAPAGNVYVLNRMTGTLQTTKDGRLNKVPPATQGSSRSITCSSHYPAFGIQFNLNLKVIGQSVYYKLNLSPEVSEGRKVVQAKWNEHIDRLRLAPDYRMPTANLNLGTADGFYLYEQRINLNDTIEILSGSDKSGSERQAQGHLDLSREVLDVLTGCTIGFAGFPPVTEELSEPMTKFTPDKPE